MIYTIFNLNEYHALKILLLISTNLSRINLLENQIMKNFKEISNILLLFLQKPNSFFNNVVEAMWHQSPSHAEGIPLGRPRPDAAYQEGPADPYAPVHQPQPFSFLQAPKKPSSKKSPSTEFQPGISVPMGGSRDQLLMTPSQSMKGIVADQMSEMGTAATKVDTMVSLKAGSPTTVICKLIQIDF